MFYSTSKVGVEKGKKIVGNFAETMHNTYNLWIVGSSTDCSNDRLIQSFDLGPQFYGMCLVVDFMVHKVVSLKGSRLGETLGLNLGFMDGVYGNDWIFGSEVGSMVDQDA